MHPPWKEDEMNAHEEERGLQNMLADIWGFFTGFLYLSTTLPTLIPS